MATPIKATPILSGSSSRKFNQVLVSEQTQKVSTQERQRIQSLVEKVLTKKVAK
ncbi:hypothetical protein SAMN05216464_1105 [Mucilaginibacter pineti]|uniref:Uncharacterized protein n=1 Tax=Mucilaginibacter pineti TaxID=1391627 RepID=A0A1G7G7M5_9SPHI|nr:hypothetical protein [Mucilaginibacter pineti]SDE84039.1 hypothetical protein SAMN05216464_1105 [Mucilaginibacter pineti]